MTHLIGNFVNRVKFEINDESVHEICAPLSLDNTSSVEHLVKLCIKIKCLSTRKTLLAHKHGVLYENVKKEKVQFYICSEENHSQTRGVCPFGSPLVIRKVAKYSIRL